MRVTGSPESRFLGYVQVKVASRIFTLPVEAAPLARQAQQSEAGAGRREGFFFEGSDRFGILVDSDATDDAQKATIERASADAARHISLRLLN